MRTPRDLAGLQFGRLQVLERVRGKMWRVRCSCGSEFEVQRGNMVNGHTQSCGCLQRERAAAAQRIHGHAGDRRSGVYNVWAGIVQRTTNPRSHNWPDYGGRGITMCDRWRRSYAAFAEDMGARPSRAHSIDRIDNDGPYEPGNCRWSTRSDQGRNRRNVHLFDVDDRPLGFREAAHLLAMPESTFRLWILRG